MDILDRLVSLAQISGSINVRCVFQGSWFVRHTAKRAQGLAHIVVQGSGFLKLDGENTVRELNVGDVVFFPRTSAHVLSSETNCRNEQAQPEILQQGAFVLKQRVDAGDKQLTLFCAQFEYEKQSDLMRGLPEVVHLNTHQAAVQNILMLLQQETAQAGQGGGTVVNALATVLLVLLVRDYLSQSERDAPLTGTLNAWRDKRLRAVVQAVSDAPEQAWRVEDLAEVAKLSRAQLMRVFHSTMGTSPHAFVNTMRLQKAALLLRTTQDTVLAVALESGFQSETHFGKAFKKYYGCTPKQYRTERVTAMQPENQLEDYAI